MTDQLNSGINFELKYKT